MSQNLGMRVLVGALVVDFLCALLISLSEFGELVAGEYTIRGLAAVLGFLSSGVVLVAAGFVGRSLYAARRDLARRTQSLVADEGLRPEWVWESDTDHRLTYSNGGIRTVLGYEPADVVGRSGLSLLPEDQREAAQRLVQQALRERRGWETHELTWLHADGSSVVLRGHAAAIKDERGSVIGFRGSRRAITDEELAARSVAAARDRVRGVLASGATDVALQPIIDLSTGRLAGVEALARFRDGRSPDVWFGEARESGLELDLDRLTFDNALRVLPELAPGTYLALNATPELVLSGHLVDVLVDSAVPCERIVLEITEHARVDSYDDLVTALAPLREHGVRLAIDDTGAGYASLAHVLKLRPNIIKIDRSLITHIASDPARRSVVTALILLALDLDASVAAEGIETPSELETLATMGIDLGQGYLLARPSPDPQRWARWATRNWLGDSAPAASEQ